MAERESDVPDGLRKLSRSKLVKGGLVLGLGAVYLAYKGFSRRRSVPIESSPAEEITAGQIYISFGALFDKLDGREGVVSNSDESGQNLVTIYGNDKISLFKYKNAEKGTKLLVYSALANEFTVWDISKQKIQKTVAKNLGRDLSEFEPRDAKTSELKGDELKDFDNFLQRLFEILPAKDTPSGPQKPFAPAVTGEQTRV